MITLKKSSASINPGSKSMTRKTRHLFPIKTNASICSVSGVMTSAKVLVAVVVVVALLLALTVLGFSNSMVSDSSASTRVVTSTVTDAGLTQTVTVGGVQGSSNNSAGLNSEEIYAAANESIVTLQGTQVVSTTGLFGSSSQIEAILGSGFVVSYSGNYYIVTNYHVAGATSNLTVTFSDGNSYAAKVVGSDPYSDLAIVQGEKVPSSEYYPLILATSSTLEVGQYVVAIGNPYGLVGSETFGIISQLGRTIQDPTAGNFSIAGVIQFSAPINPGNSGGALLDSDGFVVGMTTATVSGSQGVGFAIPSDTIIKEFPSLVSTGSYNQHSYLGIDGVDMTLQLAEAAGTNITYGVLVEQVLAGSPAADAGLRAGSTTVSIEGSQYLIGGDIIISMNGTRIINNDALASYLAQQTIPGQHITVGIVRGGKETTLDMTLGTRPPLSS